MFRKAIFAVFGLAAVLQVASASPIQYTFSFLGAGSLNGVGFTARNVTFSFTSDTSLIGQISSNVFATPAGAPGTFNLAGLASGKITESVLVFDNQNVPDAGFYLTAVPMDFFDIIDPAYGPYDLKSPTGPINTPAVSALYPNGVATDGGQLIITSARSMVFTAAAPGVPEPASLSLFAAGLLGLTFFRFTGGRRRSSVASRK